MMPHASKPPASSASAAGPDPAGTPEHVITDAIVLAGKGCVPQALRIVLGSRALQTTAKVPTDGSRRTARHYYSRTFVVESGVVGAAETSLSRGG